MITELWPGVSVEVSRVQSVNLAEALPVTSYRDEEIPQRVIVKMMPVSQDVFILSPATMIDYERIRDLICAKASLEVGPAEVIALEEAQRELDSEWGGDNEASHE